MPVVPVVKRSSDQTESRLHLLSDRLRDVECCAFQSIGQVIESSGHCPRCRIKLLQSIKIVAVQSEGEGMARTFTITLSDDLAQALTAQAERLNKSPEEIMLQVLSQQLTMPFQSNPAQQVETDPLLRLIGSLDIAVPDLAENHDYYIGQALYQELKVHE